jgi:non-specific serine/threonine protein kinase
MRLFGAAEALREAVGYWQEHRERALREPYLTAARSRMDEAVWETAFAEGMAMGSEQAVEYALLEVAPPTPSPLEPDQPIINARPPALTRREGEVANLVARGLTNRQIAQELIISEHTVENHVAHILKKLNLHLRKQVASRIGER